MNRRGFFKRVATAVAIIALAPEIAFNRKLMVTPDPEFWSVTSRVVSYTDDKYLAAFDEAQIWMTTARLTPTSPKDLMDICIIPMCDNERDDIRPQCP
jgi:hypothetical protein